MNRASDSGSEGRAFESHRGHRKILDKLLVIKVFFYLYISWVIRLFVLIQQDPYLSLPFIYGKSLIIGIVGLVNICPYTWGGRVFGLDNIVYQIAVQPSDFLEKKTLEHKVDIFRIVAYIHFIHLICIRLHVI